MNMQGESMESKLFRIPILRTGKKHCPKYIYALETALHSDGCTAVSEAYHDCCVIHDLGYKLGIDPWGHPINKAEADLNFRKCMQSKSPLGKFSPMSWWRWLAVKVFGKKFYPKTTPSFETYKF